MLHYSETEENLKSGWIKIYRSSKNHWLYPKHKQLTKWEAWIAILMEVNYKSEKVIIGGEFFECGRGEKMYSLETWAKVFNWPKSKVRRFFLLLKKDSMIELKPIRKTTHLKVCNYESYQDVRNDNETILNQLKNNTEPNLKPIKESKELDNLRTNNYSSFPRNEVKKNGLEFSKKKKGLSGDSLIAFNEFWEKFDFKKGKSEAIDAWQEIENLTPELLQKINKAALIEANERKELKSGQYPKWAAGWLKARRWEDEHDEKKRTVFVIRRPK